VSYQDGQILIVTRDVLHTNIVSGILQVKRECLPKKEAVVQNHPRRRSGGGREEARGEEVEGVKRACIEPGKKFSPKMREVSQ
jgi:hypothetical protein